MSEENYFIAQSIISRKKVQLTAESSIEVTELDSSVHVQSMGKISPYISLYPLEHQLSINYETFRNYIFISGCLPANVVIDGQSFSPRINLSFHETLNCTRVKESDFIIAGPLSVDGIIVQGFQGTQIVSSTLNFKVLLSNEITVVRQTVIELDNITKIKPLYDGNTNKIPTHNYSNNVYDEDFSSDILSKYLETEHLLELYKKEIEDLKNRLDNVEKQNKELIVKKRPRILRIFEKKRGSGF